MYKDWTKATLGADLKLMPWLHDCGSLTWRIKQRCECFSVQAVRSGLARISSDESRLLKIAPQQLAWSRDVFLCADEQPVVFAHSTCDARHLTGAWYKLRTLGDQPLGAVLFSQANVIRQPLHYQALSLRHALYRRATSALSCPPKRLWARRSLFYLHNAPLLVTEVFLPEILKLRVHHDER
jgi:chorismate--pyruvate lyase